MGLANKLFKGDRVIWMIFIILCLISMIEVFSATSTLTYKSSNYWGPVGRHVYFLAAGFVLILILHNVPSRFLSLLSILLPISIGLLIITPIFGKETNAAHRFLSLGGLSFQPSEIAKLGSVVFVAFLLSRQKEYGVDRVFKYILIGVGIACVLIFLDNISTSAILFLICYLMMFIGQIPLKKIALLTVTLLLFAALFVAILFAFPDKTLEKTGRRLPTAKGRITDFFVEKPPLDASTYKITNDNYQVSHAQIAIANGGILGKMPGHGQQRDFLPQAFSDFIYAIIIEELGIAGGFFVLFLYIILMIRVGLIARKCERLFPKYLVIGCGLMIIVQAFANMAVAVGLFPVTGQPLPLVSRGGTSTVISCIYIGIILSVSRFGAGMGNEDEEEEDDLQPEFIEIETDIADDSSLTAIETLTEKK
jgi:cell division protein FtsW